MATKIRELQNELKAGSRSNKYRVLFPFIGNKLDILCHNITSPGRAIGAVELFYKGRKYQLAGDRGDEESITLSFYNDQDLILRRFFMKLIEGIQGYYTPETMFDTLNSFLPSINNITLPQGLNEIDDLYSELKNNALNVQSFLNNLSVDMFRNMIGNNTNAGLFNTYGYGRPWYQFDIVIQQLGPDEDVQAEILLMDAFISTVGGIDYIDEVGEITQTELTINFSGTQDSQGLAGKLMLQF